MKILTSLLSAIVLFSLAACASAPKPPTVNGHHRSSINSEADAQLLALQVFPEAPAASAANHAVQVSVPKSSTVSVHFPWNVYTFRPTTEQVGTLRALLRSGYARIEVRGRTDASSPSAGDEFVAAKRAAAARDWLIQEGVPAAAIAMNYASAADQRGGNNYSRGRAMNRRVDIEIIRK